MPATASNEILDAVVEFSQGMNAGIAPDLLPKNQLAMARNVTVRGDFVTNRPPFRKITVADGDWQNGRFQGCSYYKPDVGAESIIAQIAGDLWMFTPGAQSAKTATVAKLTLYGVLQAFFSVNVVSGTEPLMVQFTDASTGTIASYDWDFGDSSAHSTQQSPSHTYAAGAWTATLTITGPGGDTATYSLGINVTSATSLPIAGFTAKSGTTDLHSGSTVTVGDTIVFTNISTGTITGHKWWFGDAASPPSGATDSTSASPTHAFAAAGDYTVTLIESDGTHTSTYTMDFTVAAIGAPVAAFWATTFEEIASVNTEVTITTAPTFQVLATHADLLSVGQWWNMLVTPGDLTFYRIAAQVVSKVIDDDGSAIVTLASAEAVNGHIVQAGYVALVATPATGTVPLGVLFLNRSTGSITGYEWWFGDGNPTSGAADSTVAYPNHTYAAAGTYTVTLKVTGVGGSSTTTAQIVVLPVVPTANFTADANSGVSPLTVTFTDTSTGTPTSWAWDFGDPDNSTVDNPNTSTAQNPSHIYTAAGNYVVKLIATNAGGSGAAKTMDITVTVPAPPRFTVAATPTSGTLGTIFEFTVTPTSDSGTITSYDWALGGDGSYGWTSGSLPYSFAGLLSGVSTGDIFVKYDTLPLQVQVKAYGPGGSSAWVTVPVTVSGPPTANFTFTPTNGPTSTLVTFTDTSTNSPTSWAWDFGDGGTSTAQNPTHTYASVGSYDVTLTVTKAGVSDTKKVVGAVVIAAAPSASFTVGRYAANGGIGVLTMTDTSSGTVTSRVWSFSDGANNGTSAAYSRYFPDGTYTITLTVTGPGGISVSTRTIKVTTTFTPNCAVVLVYNGPIAHNVDLYLTLNPGTYLTTGGSINWGEGVPTPGQVVTNHTYGSAGAKTITWSGEYINSQQHSPYTDSITIT